MALSQLQIIRSLSEALSWLEKEVQWGAPLGELRHLTSRIGELYVAMTTRGQMALAVNQRGYDVVSAGGEHISVKTITTATHADFNPNTYDKVDRVVMISISVLDDDISIEELVDMPATEFLKLCRMTKDKYVYPIRRKSVSIQQTIPSSSSLQSAGELRKISSHAVKKEPRDILERIKDVTYGSYRLVELENGTIQVFQDDQEVQPTKPVLRKIAADLGVNILNGSGNPKNTRTLGSDVISAITTNIDGRE